ncbi:MAG: hypothetical protein KDC83_04860 [Flavobacteriales bacterium]|nr:hypothetical protein [Flavobacteriales bacterium]
MSRITSLIILSNLICYVCLSQDESASRPNSSAEFSHAISVDLNIPIKVTRYSFDYPNIAYNFQIKKGNFMIGELKIGISPDNSEQRWNLKNAYKVGFYKKSFYAKFGYVSYANFFFGEDGISVNEKQKCFNNQHGTCGPSDQWSLPIEHDQWLALNFGIETEKHFYIESEVGYGIFYDHNTLLRKEEAFIVGLNLGWKF